MVNILLIYDAYQYIACQTTLKKHVCFCEMVLDTCMHAAKLDILS